MKHDDRIDELLARLPRHRTPEALRRSTRIAALDTLQRESSWSERLRRYALTSGLTLFSAAYTGWIVYQALLLG